MCALLFGRKTIPTWKNIEKLSPVLVSKQTVSGILEFLLTHKAWYRQSGVNFSQVNFNSLFSSEDHSKDSALFQAIELCHLPSEHLGGAYASIADYTRCHINDRLPSNELIMEAISYVVGDHTPQDYNEMKA
jgi:hypothetical protein